jgi:ATP-binding cassette subfamily B protein
VRFGYPGADRTVLDGLDLDIRPGETLALVGLNGAGKTTIGKLLAGLYEPDAGRITIDGLDLHHIGVVAWRRRLAVLFQDFLRYELPVRDNVTLGRPDPADDTELHAAATDAGLAGLIDDLPHGWDTPLAPGRSGGVDLSGGQWQRVALARALFAVRGGADVLVLDEPTAHLDVGTEAEVLRQVARVGRHASVVLISHRLSTVRRADRIVLIEHGRVTESGTHRELLAADGSYARLFRLQAQQFASVP